MRIFLVWVEEINECADLISGLKQSGHEIVYWLSTKKNQGKLPGTIVHDHYDAWLGISPPELATEEFDPPSEELIKKLFSVESIIMTMMNKHFEGMCVDERKNYYYNLLGYWYGVLNKFKPEAIIFPAPPHPTFLYLIFELARLLKIKTLIFEHIIDIGRMLWYNNIWQGNQTLLGELAANRDKKFTVKDLSEDLQLYLKHYADENKDATPEYLKDDLKKNNFKNKIILLIRLALKSVKDFTILKKVFLYLKKLLINNIQKEYRRFCTLQPDFSKKFIYVPLHLQPEMTTSPMGGVFASQILMIKILAAALPAGWKIYVKEHPVQWMFFGLNYNDYRYPGYYQQIAQIKNVKLVPIKTNSFSLIKQAQAVATVTGTAGWEAILRGKPALVFGHAWYNDCAGVFKVDSVESCRSALEKIANGYRLDDQAVMNYLKCFELASIRGLVDKWTGINVKLTKREGLTNILSVINNELKKIT
ncbi:MAG: capsular polysaccharide biosynthesis protein [Parcubacteria group bacterium GW2011_GWC2_42_12]|uniref:Capsule polysaccharide biosynthesis protein n=1 Tax=Candidatus Falkowbacteria bacterium RIFCSPHIGHO2_02_FULL_42_9 TaxID=1797986 RepID=A0A1F5SA25_9BACT|nr:MAG: capsular polysaccharide biosynthesis protein [Parcubacteria group bacterium GW2011_GWC2_42_12]OGF23466.1 MAG: hypothetical protein A3D45_01050 [Candidatus Falkowbacteria bacterium RIFCSPHIGHO2_02_FULL_42_9]